MEYLPAVSVIVPIYNVEKYIGRCVRSLFEQTLEDIEYIFINDCTPDNSMGILRTVIEEYPQRQGRIKIIEFQENKGVSYARNAGLQASNGSYLIYCDADDWVETDMYEKMYRKAVEEEADMVGCDFYMEYADRRVEKKQPFSTDAEVCIENILKEELHSSTWNKLIKRDLYVQNHVVFPTGVNCWEDLTVILQLCYYSKKISYIPSRFYHYVQYNTTSILRLPGKRNIEGVLTACKIIESFLQKKGVFDRYYLEFICLVLPVKSYLILDKALRDYNRCESLWPEFKKDIWKIDRRWDLRLMYWFIYQRWYCLVRLIFHCKMHLKKILSR